MAQIITAKAKKIWYGSNFQQSVDAVDYELTHPGPLKKDVIASTDVSKEENTIRVRVYGGIENVRQILAEKGFIIVSESNPYQ